ncbi:MAG: GDSL-type esterase/lipase family protein [Lentisphaeria bacterium]|nr:GDSL-type esterase/lipase family protein [Lentisphaeria bacterium]
MYKVLLSIFVFLLLSSCSGEQDFDYSKVKLKNDKILCWGDSLVAGVGASNKEQTYPQQLGRILNMPVDQLGISGQTTVDALKQLDDVLSKNYGVVIITLGGNDFIKRTWWPDTKNAIIKIIDDLQESGTLVVFTATVRQDQYLKIAEEKNILLVPDVMDGLLHHDQLMADTIHPNDKGYKIFAQKVADKLLPIFTLTQP